MTEPDSHKKSSNRGGLVKEHWLLMTSVTSQLGNIPMRKCRFILAPVKAEEILEKSFLRIIAKAAKHKSHNHSYVMVAVETWRFLCINTLSVALHCVIVQPVISTATITSSVVLHCTIVQCDTENKKWRMGAESLHILHNFFTYCKCTKKSYAGDLVSKASVANDNNGINGYVPVHAQTRSPVKLVLRHGALPLGTTKGEQIKYWTNSHHCRYCKNRRAHGFLRPPHTWNMF